MAHYPAAEKMADETQRSRASIARARRRSATADKHAGRRLSLSIEALGEALLHLDGLPPEHRKQATALAEGRSRVPADGDGLDHVLRLRRGVPMEDGAMALEAWLGYFLAEWLAAAAPTDVGDPLAVAIEARRILMEPWEACARAYGAWYGAGLTDDAAEVFRRASRIALGEACDRWCALGSEGDLGRYVAKWQRSASGWADRLLGLTVGVSIGDLGQLRELSAAVAEMAVQADASGVSAALAHKLGWPRAEVERLLKVNAAVQSQRDPKAVIKRRWSIVGPIAHAVSVLEGELGRMPTVAEIAERAGVHEVSVELTLDALDDG